MFRLRYNDEDKFLSQTVYNKSPGLYRLLRNELKIPLPHTVTLKRWNIFKYVPPGIQVNIKRAAKVYQNNYNHVYQNNILFLYSRKKLLNFPIKKKFVP